MELVYATLSLAFGIIGFFATLLWSRNPQRPAWASEFLIGSILLPLVLGALVIGGCFLVKGIVTLGQLNLTVGELVSLAGIAVGTLVVCKLMRVKKRLSAYATAAHQPA
jgi:hypothetical protein